MGKAMEDKKEKMRKIAYKCNNMVIDYAILEKKRGVILNKLHKRFITKKKINKLSEQLKELNETRDKMQREIIRVMIIGYQRIEELEFLKSLDEMACSKETDTLC